jgi:hypothetical protein
MSVDNSVVLYEIGVFQWDLNKKYTIFNKDGIINLYTANFKI